MAECDGSRRKQSRVDDASLKTRRRRKTETVQPCQCAVCVSVSDKLLTVSPHSLQPEQRILRK